MRRINVKDAKAAFSGLLDDALRGEFVTITRHGKPVAALVSVEAAQEAAKAVAPKRAGLVAYLTTFPGDDLLLERNRAPSRDLDFFERVSARHQCDLPARAGPDRGCTGISCLADAHGW